ncbi:MAG: S58 family peptidase [Acidobacteria bacterium]|nr:S58 family peptidase [Acidobacteriota bacterium]
MLRLIIIASLALTAGVSRAQQARPRAREVGLDCWTLPAGRLNAITDVAGVRVGHSTLIRGLNVRTGVTAVLPHGGNLFQEKVRGAVHVGNAFGKLAGSTQVNELGEIETPVLLTATLNVPRVADALITYMLGLPGNEAVRSINPLVGETNDGTLNDIRGRQVGVDEVTAAIRGAGGGPVEEGAVGAGTGTIAFGWKGGIGTASRQTAAGHTVGVLVQSNFGGDLRMCGAPVGRELRPRAPGTADGSIMLVVATDAPADHRLLQRLAARTMWGLARTGSSGSHGSGDYGIAFSTHRGPVGVMPSDAVSALLLAVVEASEEAIYNSMLKAVSVTGNGRTIEAIPVERVRAVLAKAGGR